MPLDKSGSKASVGANIAAETKAGKPRDQAIAIALSTQRRALGKPARPNGLLRAKGRESSA